jgi:hypothetical protein
MMPQFQENSYAISDPLNPPESYLKLMKFNLTREWEFMTASTRSQVTGAAFDTVRERFTVVGKQAKAFGAGIKAATEFEKVKGDYLDYQGHLETNEQKGISLGVSQHKT